MEHRFLAGNDSRVHSFQKGRRVYDISSGTFKPTEQTRLFLKKISEGEQINYVHQTYYGISRFGHTARYLVTPALTVCVGLTLYHKSTQTGVLAHLDNNDPWLSVHVIGDHLRRLGVSAEQCVARIIGGQDGQSEEELIRATMRALDEAKTPIIEMDILGKDIYRDLIFDSADGIVYDNQLEVIAYREMMSQINTNIMRDIGAPIVLHNQSPNGL